MKIFLLCMCNTVQATTGIAALHPCFLRVNPPSCTQITQEIHAAQNKRVKKYKQNTRKLLETESKILHVDCTYLTTFIFG